MGIKIGGVDGDKRKGTLATGGGKDHDGNGDGHDGGRERNKRVPPGVLKDESLQSLGEAHAQIENPHDDNKGANFGGIESVDAD